jgi:hypothetical protein
MCASSITLTSFAALSPKNTDESASAAWMNFSRRSATVMSAAIDAGRAAGRSRRGRGRREPAFDRSQRVVHPADHLRHGR